MNSRKSSHNTCFFSKTPQFISQTRRRRRTTAIVAWKKRSATASSGNARNVLFCVFVCSFFFFDNGEAVYQNSIKLVSGTGAGWYSRHTVPRSATLTGPWARLGAAVLVLVMLEIKQLQRIRCYCAKAVFRSRHTRSFVRLFFSLFKRQKPFVRFGRSGRGTTYYSII